MNNIVVLLEDDSEIEKSAKTLFAAFSFVELELKTFKKEEDFIFFIKNNRAKIKVWIVDLAGNKQEEDSGNFSISKTIKEEYKSNRIPIFIHSGQLARFEDFQDQGTVYKVEKSRNSLTTMFNQIKLMQEAKFLDIFCIEGKLEKELMNLLHEAFVSQFKGNEIEQILKSIKEEPKSDRTFEVFRRLAIRALLQDLMSTSLNVENSKLSQVEVNTVEYYYRRKCKPIPVWTGDVFKKNDEEKYFIVLTPRCDLAKTSKSLRYLICEITNTFMEELNKVKASKKDKKLMDSITDNRIGERFRYLPKAIRFKGGEVDFNTYQAILHEEFKEKYSYKISIVDDLTNDIVRKFASFISRGGIFNMNSSEGKHYLENSVEK